jgi:hypothetical protein
MTAKSISIKIVLRRFGGCVLKAVILTSGGLRCVPERTEGIERNPERDAGVSRGHSSLGQSDHSIGTLTRKGRNGRDRRSGNVWGKA